MYRAIIRVDRRVWKTVYLKNKLKWGVITIDGERFVVRLTHESDRGLIYDVEYKVEGN